MVVVRTSSEAANIPGDYFKPEIFARDITWFVAFENEEPVGQIALVRKGDHWWLDYLYVRKDMRGQGIVPALIKEIFPFAAEITDYLFENCEGVLPEDLERNSKKYNLPMDILTTGQSKEKPVTLIRRHVYPLQKKKTG